MTRRHLWNWVYHYTGVKIPFRSVCAGHSSLFDLFARQFFERPSLSLWHGPRGSGKSYLSAIETHMTSRFNPRARHPDPGRFTGAIGTDLRGAA